MDALWERVGRSFGGLSLFATCFSSSERIRKHVLRKWRHSYDTEESLKYLFFWSSVASSYGLGYSIDLVICLGRVDVLLIL